MSKPYNPEDVFDSPSRADGDFAREEALRGYRNLAETGQNADLPVPILATAAVRLAMIVTGRFDVDARVAAEALIGNLDAQVIREE